MLFSSLSAEKRAALFSSLAILFLIGFACLIWQTIVFPKKVSVVKDPIQRAYDALHEASPTPVSVQMYHGTARFVEASVKVKGATPVERAQEYLRQYGALYGVTSASDTHFVWQRTHRTDEHDATVIFSQKYKNLPVFGGQLLISVQDDHVYSSVGSLFVPRRPISVEPVLSSAQALDRAREAMGAKQVTTYADPQLEIFDPLVSDAALATSSHPHLAWRVFVATPEQKEVHLDAMNGTVLSLFGTVYGHGGLDDFDFDLEDANGSEATTLNACYRFTDADDWIGDEDGLETAYHRDRDAVQTWWDFRNVYQFFHNTFALHSYDDDGEDIETYIHAGGSVVGSAASYNGSCDVFQISNGNAAFDIATHEFTHAIIGQTSQLVYQNQSGALNESFADIMAAVAEPNWLIGEARTGGRGVVRDLSNPPRFGHPDTMPPLTIMADNGGVHTNSGIQNKVAFLIADGGVHNGTRVEPIGRAKLGQLMFNVMRTLPSSAQMNDARNRAVAVADSWARGRVHGFTTQDACSVRNAYYAAGFRGWDDNARQDSDCDGTEDSRDADRDNDGVPDPIDNCPGVRNIDQANADGDAFGDACDTDADNDGVADSLDNCPTVPNPRQEVDRRTGRGYACQDSDRDGILNATDNCPEGANPDQRDGDGDGIGDVCDPDWDQDGVGNRYDNCPLVRNSDQQDGDRDERGDACDNCPRTSNTNQRDRDHDGIGDACDPDRDGDGVRNEDDPCPDFSFCPSTQEGVVGSFVIPSTPHPEVVRLPFASLFCPTCLLAARTAPSSTCHRLVAGGASARDVMWLTDVEGAAAGHFHVSSGTQSVFLREAFNQTYALNISPAVRRSGTSSTVVELRIEDTACMTPRPDSTHDHVMGTWAIPTSLQPTSTMIRASTTIENVSPVDGVDPKTGEKMIPVSVTEKSSLGTSPEKNTPSVTSKPSLDVTADFQKQDPIVSPPPMEEKTQPIFAENPPVSQTPFPPIAEPVFSTKPPLISSVVVTPKTTVYYGECTSEPTRVHLEFTAQSTNPLTTIGVTYQTLREDGTAVNGWKNAQLFSLGSNRFMVELDAQAFGMDELKGLNGTLKYRIELLDAAGLAAVVEDERPLSACIMQKK